MIISTIDRANILTQALPYIQKFRNKTVVIKYGGNAMLNYKLKDLIDKPEAEWKRTENAHEAIIQKNDFDLVQKIMRLDTRTAPGGDKVYLFSGVLICGSCGSRMTRKVVPQKGVKYYYYYCPTTKKRGCDAGVNIKESSLSECILESVKIFVAEVACLEEVIAGSDAKRIIDALVKQYTDQILENEKQLAQINNFKTPLYENMINGIISNDDYKNFKNKYANDEQRLRESIKSLKAQLEDVVEGKSERLRWMEHFKQFGNLEELDRRTVTSLIQSVHVYSKTEVLITFHYQAEYQNAIALLKREVA